MEVTSFSRGPRHLVKRIQVIFVILLFIDLTESCHRKVEYHYKLKRPPPHHNHHQKPHGHGYHRGPPVHGGRPHHGGGHEGGYHNIHKGYVPVRSHHHQGGGGHPDSGHLGRHPIGHDRYKGLVGHPTYGKYEGGLHHPHPEYFHGKDVTPPYDHDEQKPHGHRGYAEVHGAGYPAPGHYRPAHEGKEHEQGVYEGPPREAGHYGGRPKGHDTPGYNEKGYKYQMFQTHQYDDKNHEYDESTPVYLQKGYGKSSSFENVEYRPIPTLHSPPEHFKGPSINSFNMFDDKMNGKSGQQLLRSGLDAAETADLIRKGKERILKQKETFNPSMPLEDDTSGYYAELERLAELYAGSHLPSKYSTEPRLYSSEKLLRDESLKSHHRQELQPQIQLLSNNRFRDEQTIINHYQSGPSQHGRLTDPRFPDSELPNGPQIDTHFQDESTPTEDTMDFQGSQLPSMSNNNQSPNIPTAILNLPATGNTPLVYEEADTNASTLPSQDITSHSDGNFNLNLNYNSELPAAFRRNVNDMKKRRRRRRKKINSKYARMRPNPTKPPQISHHRDFSTNNLELQASTTQHHQQIYKGGSDYLEDDFM